MGGSEPPPAPDPVATANAQASANVQTAIANTALGNANVNSPTGSTRFDVTGHQTVTDVSGNKIDVPTYTQTTTLSPEQQKLYDQQVGLGQGLNDTAATALKNAQGVLSSPTTTSPTLSTSYGNGGAIQTSLPQQTSLGLQTDLGLQTSVPVSQTANTFGQTAQGVQYGLNTGDLNAARDSATNAALGRLQPSMNQDDATLAATLAGQGVQQGSAAWNAAMQSRDAAKNDLRLGAVQVGDAEQQAGFGQALSAGQFHNAAQQQDYNQLLGRAQFGLSADQSNNAADLAAGQFGNAAKTTQGDFFNNAQATQGAFANSAQQAQGAFANAAQAQANSQSQAAAGFGNSAALQQFQADAATRELPLNEISALMSGGQVSMPQFSGYQGGTVAQTPYSQDVYASAQMEQQAWAQQQQQQAAMMQGLFGLAGKMGGMFSFSDRRLKRDVVRLGRMPSGLDLYAYRYAWGGDLEVGHMADEVEAVAPHAVAQHPSGFAMVDYGAL